MLDLSLFTYKIYRGKDIYMIDTKNDREVDTAQTSEIEDPVLAMLGVGRYLWDLESGERFVERLRSEESDVPSSSSQPRNRGEELPEAVWRNIEKYQKEAFHTATRLPFTFEVEGNGIWFFRDGRRINRKLTRAQVEIAISRCPLKSTTEIKDLMDYAYLFALLMDRRIRGDAW
jgi:hypothetical protein